MHPLPRKSCVQKDYTDCIDNPLCCCTISSKSGNALLGICATNLAHSPILQLPLFLSSLAKILLELVCVLLTTLGLLL